MSMASWISTGHLPSAAVVSELVEQAHRRFATVREGTVASYIPALAAADPERFAIAVASTGGQVFEAGEAGQSFSIQSLSKPFLYALICEAIGEREGRDKLGVNSAVVSRWWPCRAEAIAAGLSKAIWP